MIYHLTPAADWEAGLSTGQYRRSTRGLTLDEVGYIHCSFEDQVDRVARYAFAGATGLVLLSIDPLLVDAEIRYEKVDGSNELFPHIYGPVNVNAVVAVRRHELDDRAQ